MTVEYYDRHAEAFAADTINADMRVLRDWFLGHVRRGGHILDAGCGPGRDAKAFAELGYSVTAFDASAAMVALARSRGVADVAQMRFEDVAWSETFDGVWACASLLHVRAADLQDVLDRLGRALVPGGVIFASFKRGQGERVSPDGRVFCDQTGETLADSVARVPHLRILEVRETRDVRPDRGDEWWVNVLLGRRGKVVSRGFGEGASEKVLRQRRHDSLMLPATGRGREPSRSNI